MLAPWGRRKPLPNLNLRGLAAAPRPAVPGPATAAPRAVLHLKTAPDPSWLTTGTRNHCENSIGYEAGVESKEGIDGIVIERAAD